MEEKMFQCQRDMKSGANHVIFLPVKWYKLCLASRDFVFLLPKVDKAGGFPGDDVSIKYNEIIYTKLEHLNPKGTTMGWCPTNAWRLAWFPHCVLRVGLQKEQVLAWSFFLNIISHCCARCHPEDVLNFPPFVRIGQCWMSSCHVFLLKIIFEPWYTLVDIPIFLF